MKPFALLLISSLALAPIVGLMAEDGAATKETRHQRRLEQFDADKDGKLNDQEKAAAWAAHEARFKERHPKAFAKLDTNGDGHLDAAERKAAHDQWVAKRDTDKDGKVSPEERKAWRAKHQDEREAKFKERHPKAFAKLDTNGDGHLDEAERKAARDQRIAKRDTDHDGKVSPEERKAWREAHPRRGGRK
jgi:Ca2+-binding EF-hand superfamily protein